MRVENPLRCLFPSLTTLSHLVGNVRLTGGIVKHSRIRLVHNAPPGDLVGAITGEAGINARERDSDRRTLLAGRVPAARAAEIIAALKATTRAPLTTAASWAAYHPDGR